MTPQCSDHAGRCRRGVFGESDRRMLFLCCEWGSIQLDVNDAANCGTIIASQAWSAVLHPCPEQNLSYCRQIGSGTMGVSCLGCFARESAATGVSLVYYC